MDERTEKPRTRQESPSVQAQVSLDTRQSPVPRAATLVIMTPAPRPALQAQEMREQTLPPHQAQLGLWKLPEPSTCDQLDPSQTGHQPGSIRAKNPKHLKSSPHLLPCRSPDS